MKGAEMDTNTAVCESTLLASSVHETVNLQCKDSHSFDYPVSMMHKQPDSTNSTTVKSQTDPDKKFETRISKPLSHGPQTEYSKHPRK